MIAFRFPKRVDDGDEDGKTNPAPPICSWISQVDADNIRMGTRKTRQIYRIRE